MQNKSFRTALTTLGTGAANLLNGGAAPTSVGFTATAPVVTVKKVAIVNRTGGSVTVSLFIGATAGSAAGTEYLFSAYPIPANSYVERYCNTRLEAADFLTGLASAATSLTIEIEGEYGFQ